MTKKQQAIAIEKAVKMAIKKDVPSYHSSHNKYVKHETIKEVAEQTNLHFTTLSRIIL